MRTTPFKTIFDRVVRMHGRDPRQAITSDMANSLVDRINDRVKQIWQAWRWPEWEITEERAFRPIWGSTEQYLRESLTDGQPDEVFYLGDDYNPGGDFGANYGYYSVLPAVLPGDLPPVIVDPPVGTLPTDTDYWEPLDPVDTFIPYDQRDRRAIGMVLGVYSRDPRVPTGSAYGILRSSLSERGIDVMCVGVPTVFITHKMPCPVYTMLPYVVGRTYARADVVFNPEDGECYQAIRSTTALPADETTSDDWNRVPFLEVWAKFVVHGAFADSLMEFDQGGNTDLQAKMVLAQAADMKAMDALQSEVDAQVVQGQTLRWNFCRSHQYGHEPWNGGMVTLIGQ